MSDVLMKGVYDDGAGNRTLVTVAVDASGRVLTSGGGSGGGGGGAVTIADGADTAGGSTSQAAASWYSAVASRLQLLKLIAAAICDAGSHVYTYDASGNLISDAWTLLGTTRTKTYTYTGGVLTAESDWV